MKTCIECNEAKNIAEFSRNHLAKDGHLNTCIDCIVSKKKTGYSLRDAINDKCRDCIYDPIAGGGTWRQQVESCTSGNCPLFDVRPISGGVA